MTIQQMQYIVAIEQYGSLSKTAKMMYVSQPNLSNAIKSLETELNIPLLIRNNKGVAFTPEGIFVLKHAKNIISQLDCINSIKTQKTCSRLKVLTQNYSYISEAFYRFTTETPDATEIDHQILHTAGKKLIQEVYQQNVDIGVDIIFEEQMTEYKHFLKDRNIVFKPLARLPVTIKFRKDHPIFQYDHIFEHLHKYPVTRFREYDYPYVNLLMSIDSLKNMNLNNIIIVSDKTMKCRLMSETDAYGIGLIRHPNDRKQYDFIRVILPETYCMVGYIYCKNHMITDEMERFIHILKEEFKTLNDSCSSELYYHENI